MGVEKVDQGYISVNDALEQFYEGILLYFNPEIISLRKLIEIHLQTHHSTSNHSMRSKYLSAVYTFDNIQHKQITFLLAQLQNNYKDAIITKAYSFGAFKESRSEIRNYYKTDPQRPFCKVYIEPKLEFLKREHASSFIKRSD